MRVCATAVSAVNDQSTKRQVTRAEMECREGSACMHTRDSRRSDEPAEERTMRVCATAVISPQCDSSTRAEVDWNPTSAETSDT